MPVEAPRRTLVDVQRNKARLWPGSTSSREIALLSSDATAARYVIERELPTCVYNPMGCSGPKRLRRTYDVLCPSAHPIGLPHSRRAPNAFKPALNFHLRPLVGYLDVVTLNVVHVLVIHRPVARWSGRIGSRRTRKYPVRRPLPGPVERTYGTTRLNFKLFYRGFLLCLADQL